MSSSSKRRLGEQQIGGVKHLLQQHGWEGSFSPAWATDKGAQAGGVAVLWKQWVQAAGGEVELHPGRCIGQPMWFKEVGLVLAVSIYGYTGRDDVNNTLMVMQQAVAGGLSCGGQLLVAGDFNLEPHVVKNWIQLRGLALEVVELECPTCVSHAGDAVLDYFVVQRQLACLLVGDAVADLYAQMSLHRPVYLDVDIRSAKDVVVPTWCKPKRSPTTHVLGPSNAAPQGWDNLAAKIDTMLGERPCMRRASDSDKGFQ